MWGDSDALLKANLAKSHSPYYLMSQLGSNARKLGRKDEALRWYAAGVRQERRPGDAAAVGRQLRQRAGRSGAGRTRARIEKAAAQLFAEAAKDKGAFHERSARRCSASARSWRSWNADGKHGRGAEAPAAPSSTPVCAQARRRRAARSACEGAAQGAGQAERLNGAGRRAAR